jgi:tRNA-splicing ligase RtcB
MQAQTERNFEVMGGKDGLIKAWTRGVPVEEGARQQLRNVASLPFIHKWVAAMPDVHWGMGATVGSVIPTDKAIIPAAVGVDLGCGMMATRTSLTANDLPDDLRPLRVAVEAAVPHGRTHNGARGDRGAWGRLPTIVEETWAEMLPGFEALCEKHPKLKRCNNVSHLGTLGTGNHFIEICLDEDQRVWFMLHSGSRGLGNRIGGYFIRKAKQEMERWYVHLPDQNLAYLPEGSRYFGDYMQGIGFAQGFARKNRELMMRATVAAVRATGLVPAFHVDEMAVNCHHNYVSRERHYGKQVYVTRKGAVSAQKGELGIIPGSMGARSFIVRGKGNPESFCSCSHGAGRAMSRTEARRCFSVEDHVRMTEGVECRKDADVIDETPAAYKDIDAVMAAQADLVEVVHTLRQVVCVKG